MTRQIDRVILFISTLISHQFSVGYNFEQELVKNDREIDNIIVIVQWGTNQNVVFEIAVRKIQDCQL
jgi:hypothetical protein